MTRDPIDDLTQKLPSRELSPEEVDALVSSVQAGLAQARDRRSRWRTAALALAAAAVAVAVLSSWWSGSREAPEAPDMAAVPAAEAPEETEGDDHVWAAAGTRYALVGPAEDRVVRLEAGRVRCEVFPRLEGGRFRVVVGDDEVEVTGTRFEVIADDDHLREVVVEEGEVVLRLRDGRIHRLVGGESWRLERQPEADPYPGPANAPVRAAAPPVPPTPAAEFGMALARYDAGDWAAARAHFAKVLDGPLVADARFWAAMSRVRLAMDAGAARVLEEALQAGVPPEREGTLRCVLGRLLADLGRVDEAGPHLAWAAADPDPAVRACGASSR